jgi:hypothetical protein
MLQTAFSTSTLLPGGGGTPASGGGSSPLMARLASSLASPLRRLQPEQQQPVAETLPALCPRLIDYVVLVGRRFVFF